MLCRQTHTITLERLLLFFYNWKTNSGLSLYGSLINNKKCARSLVAKLICGRKYGKAISFLPSIPLSLKKRVSRSFLVGIDFDRKTQPLNVYSCCYTLIFCLRRKTVQVSRFMGRYLISKQGLSADCYIPYTRTALAWR